MERNSFSHSLKDHSVGYNKAIKDKSSINIINNNNNNSYKLKDSPWSMSGSSNNQGFGDQQDYLAGFSWPPRSYTCSFCKREFRSAQALGGHMNVHRRDRARLRQSPPTPNIHGQPQPQPLQPQPHQAQPPFLNLNLNPNPNPNLSSLLVSPPLSSNLSSSSPASAFPAHHHEMKKWRVNGTLNIDALSSKGSDSTNTMMGTNANANAKSFFGVREFKDYGACKKLVTKKSNATTEYVRLDLDLEIGLVSDSNDDLDLELRLGYS